MEGAWRRIAALSAACFPTCGLTLQVCTSGLSLLYIWFKSVGKLESIGTEVYFRLHQLAYTGERCCAELQDE